MSGQEPKDMTIKKSKPAHDDKSCSSISASQDIGRIPRNKQKKRKYQKLQAQGIK